MFMNGLGRTRTRVFPKGRKASPDEIGYNYDNFVQAAKNNNIGKEDFARRLSDKTNKYAASKGLRGLAGGADAVEAARKEFSSYKKAPKMNEDDVNKHNSNLEKLIRTDAGAFAANALAGKRKGNIHGGSLRVQTGEHSYATTSNLKEALRMAKSLPKTLKNEERSKRVTESRAKNDETIRKAADAKKSGDKNANLEEALKILKQRAKKSNGGIGDKYLRPTDAKGVERDRTSLWTAGRQREKSGEDNRNKRFNQLALQHDKGGKENNNLRTITNKEQRRSDAQQAKKNIEHNKGVEERRQRYRDAHYRLDNFATKRRA